MILLTRLILTVLLMNNYLLATNVNRTNILKNSVSKLYEEVLLSNQLNYTSIIIDLYLDLKTKNLYKNILEEKAVQECNNLQNCIEDLCNLSTQFDNPNSLANSLKFTKRFEILKKLISQDKSCNFMTEIYLNIKRLATSLQLPSDSCTDLFGIDIQNFNNEEYLIFVEKFKAIFTSVISKLNQENYNNVGYMALDLFTYLKILLEISNFIFVCRNFNENPETQKIYEVDFQTLENDIQFDKVQRVGTKTQQSNEVLLKWSLSSLEDYSYEDTPVVEKVIDSLNISILVKQVSKIVDFRPFFKLIEYSRDENQPNASEALFEQSLRTKSSGKYEAENKNLVLRSIDTSIPKNLKIFSGNFIELLIDNNLNLTDDSLQSLLKELKNQTQNFKQMNPGYSLDVSIFNGILTNYITVFNDSDPSDGISSITKLFEITENYFKSIIPESSQFSLKKLTKTIATNPDDYEEFKKNLQDLHSRLFKNSIKMNTTQLIALESIVNQMKFLNLMVQLTKNIFQKQRFQFVNYNVDLKTLISSKSQENVPIFQSVDTDIKELFEKTINSLKVMLDFKLTPEIIQFRKDFIIKKISIFSENINMLPNLKTINVLVEFLKYQRDSLIRILGNSKMNRLMKESECLSFPGKYFYINEILQEIRTKIDALKYEYLAISKFISETKDKYFSDNEIQYFIDCLNYLENLLDFKLKYLDLKLIEKNEIFGYTMGFINKNFEEIEDIKFNYQALIKSIGQILLFSKELIEEMKIKLNEFDKNILEFENFQTSGREHLSIDSFFKKFELENEKVSFSEYFTIKDLLENVKNYWKAPIPSGDSDDKFKVDLILIEENLNTLLKDLGEWESYKQHNNRAFLKFSEISFEYLENISTPKISEKATDINIYPDILAYEFQTSKNYSFDFLAFYQLDNIIEELDPSIIIKLNSNDKLEAKFKNILEVLDRDSGNKNKRNFKLICLKGLILILGIVNSVLLIIVLRRKHTINT